MRPNNALTFGHYIKQLCLFVISSSVVLGLVLGVTFLLIGETTMNVDGDLDFGARDGFWLILAVPLVSLLIFVILSPLSFLVHRLLSKRGSERNHGERY